MQIEYTKKNLRNFGLLMAALFAVLGAVPFYRNGYSFTGSVVVFWISAAHFLGFSLLLPFPLRPLYFLWMSLAFALNFVMTRVILTIFYFILLAPIGLIMRFFRDPLHRAWDREAKSYWIERKEQPSPKHFEKPY
jgi:hypothetical protein